MPLPEPGGTRDLFDDGARVEVESEPGPLTRIGKPGVRHDTKPCEKPPSREFPSPSTFAENRI